MQFYAHSIEGKPVGEWHRLEEHLKGTAELAAFFAAEFGCGKWGRIAGLWYDLSYLVTMQQGFTQRLIRTTRNVFHIPG